MYKSIADGQQSPLFIYGVTFNSHMGRVITKKKLLRYVRQLALFEKTQNEQEQLAVFCLKKGL